MPDPISALLIGALIFGAAALLFLPSRGLVRSWARMRRMSERVLIEDALKHIHKCEMKDRRPTIESIAGVLNISGSHAATVLDKMGTGKLLEVEKDGGFHLTPAGRDYALRIIRAHRLWERYLADETGFTEAEWHDQAEHYEHLITNSQVDALSAKLGNPTHDPHGDPIPTASGDYVPHGGQPLTSMGLDMPARIVHIEDEPETIYAQLVAEGLYLGMEVRVTDVSSQRVHFWADGDEHLLAPMVAANISVVPLKTKISPAPRPSASLSSLVPGQSGVVTSLSPACRGLERRRLMDLGIIPGTKIRADYRSPAGDPVAYQVRDSLIALRKEQADLVFIEPVRDHG